MLVLFSANRDRRVLRTRGQRQRQDPRQEDETSGSSACCCSNVAPPPPARGPRTASSSTARPVLHFVTPAPRAGNEPDACVVPVCCDPQNNRIEFADMLVCRDKQGHHSSMSVSEHDVSTLVYYSTTTVVVRQVQLVSAHTHTSRTASPAHTLTFSAARAIITAAVCDLATGLRSA